MFDRFHCGTDPQGLDFAGEGGVKHGGSSLWHPQPAAPRLLPGHPKARNLPWMLQNLLHSTTRYYTLLHSITLYYTLFTLYYILLRYRVRYTQSFEGRRRTSASTCSTAQENCRTNVTHPNLSPQILNANPISLKP